MKALPTLGLLLLLLPACASLAPQPLEFPTRSKVEGRFLTTAHNESLTGRFLFRHGPEREIELRALKAGTLPLFTVTRQGGNWFFESEMEERRWSGHPDAAPDLVRDWIAAAMVLEAADAIGAGRNEVQTHRWQALFEKPEGRLESVRVRTESGTVFEFRLR